MTDAAKDAEVSERMAIDMYGWYRDVCTHKLLPAPIVLGGPVLGSSPPFDHVPDREEDKD